jgi:hypothetical protein
MQVGEFSHGADSILVFARRRVRSGERGGIEEKPVRNPSTYLFGKQQIPPISKSKGSVGDRALVAVLG